MGSVGTHKAYLQQNNFSNLDEYDEQVLNDTNITSFANEDIVVNGNSYTPQQLINQANKLINAKRYTNKEIQELNNVLNGLQQLSNQTQQVKDLIQELKIIARDFR